jgi:hypothetical protein
LAKKKKEETSIVEKEKRNRYNMSAKDVDKRTYDGVVYDSILEMRFYSEWLMPRLQSGEVVSCDKQVEYVLQDGFEYNGKKIRPIIYKADFVCRYRNGKELVIDTKGFAEQHSLLKRKMFWYRYPDVEYVWMSYSVCDGGWILYDDLKKARALRKKEKQKKKEVEKCQKEARE